MPPTEEMKTARTPEPPARVPARRAAWARYALPFAAVAAATLLTYGLQAVVGAESVRVVFVFYFAAVFVSTRRGGLWPGLLCVALSVLVVNYAFLAPYGALRLDPAALLQTFLFMSVALLFVYLTEQGRRAEASTRRSEESLATTLKSIGDAVITTDGRGRVTFLNPAAEKLTGWTSDEARGRDLPEVFRIVNEETRLPVESPVARVLREGVVVGLANHTALLSKDGRETPIDDSGAPIRAADGRIVGVVLVFHDITERKHAEEAHVRLAAIVESSDDAIIGKTLDGTVTNWNAAARRLYGYEAEEIIGRPISTIVPPELRTELEGVLRRIREGGKVEHLETVRVTKDGSRINVSVTISPIKNASGQIVGASTIARDITGRKRAEEERARLTAQIEGERRRLRELVSHVPGVVWEAWGEPDAAGQRIDFVSDHVEKMLGYTVEEWLQTPNFWLTIVHPEDRERAAAEARRKFESGLGGTSTFRWVAKDGRVLPVEAQSVVIRDERGEPAGMRGVTMDISARQRAEAEMRESELRYRALADAMPQIVWTTRADGYTDYYNRRWFEYTGMTFEQTEGWGFQPVLHPDDVEHTLRTWATCVQTGEPYRIEYRFRRASDGQYRWHLGRAEPLRDAAGQIVKWFGTATDIHDQKEAEERLRFLAEAGALLASTLDYEATLARLARLGVTALADYCLIDVVEDDASVRRVATAHADPALEELTAGLRKFPPDPRRGVGVAEALRTGHTQTFTHLDEERLRTVTVGGEHAALLRRLGLKSYMSVPLVSRGRIIGAITFAHTGTERAYTPTEVSFAEELARHAAIAIDNARLYGRAREVNRAKDEFLATLSHELRTPLTPIIGWTHMIRSGHISQRDAEQGLRVIDKNSQALSRLINDLLDMSSILSGKMRIERASVELASVVREAVETTRPLAESRGVSFDVALCEGAASLNINGDRTRLVQVFWNLLNNAVKFSPAGGTVRVECRSDEGAGRVEVSDDGTGIPEEFLPHVFERFRQADGSTTRAHGGLGIGLALVKSFVEAHGGSVSAASDGEGRGSRFIVSLPLARDGAGAEPVAEVAAEEAESCAEESTCHVLLVEDARDTLDMLRLVFGSRGYRTTACESAEEALRVAESTRFDIIVSDIGLPRIDGYDLIRRLRRLPHLSDIPAVALTGYAAPKDAESALAAGFDAHIPKPVDPSALAEEIEELLQQKTRAEE
ncbi:MAG TPA: PAS domain S-box protein [Pyrinomonadaceae bacterium]|nr:PAS domain S-box protein [Pyrinomonadaceae bacterium]